MHLNPLDADSEMDSLFLNKILLERLWLIFSLFMFYSGFTSIYTFANPKLLYIFTPSIQNAYESIICGSIGICIYYLIAQNKPKVIPLLIFFIGIVLTFYITDCIYIAVNQSLVLTSLVNLNNLISLILIVISLRSVQQKIIFSKECIQHKKYAFLLLIGCLPVILSIYLDYDFYAFITL